MTAKLITFGYQGLQMEQIVRMAHDTGIVVDTRFMPFSRAPMWNRKKFEEALGERYLWCKGFGNEHYKGGEILLHRPEAHLPVVQTLLTSGQSVLLMCVCPDWLSCHRRVVAQLIADRTNYQPEHWTAAEIGGRWPKTVASRSASEDETKRGMRKRMAALHEQLDMGIGTGEALGIVKRKFEDIS